jgi:hypothetical protein
MKIHQIILFGILTLLYSCSRPESSTIEFEGKKFELPIKVSEAKSSLELTYGHYLGFFSGNENEILIQTQLEDYPLFMGSDNDSEESYYDQYFAGITFFKADAELDKVKSELQKKYGREFKSKKKDFGVTRTLLPFNMTYYFIKSKEGFFVALKEIERKPDLKKYVSISFYEGISESELGDYLEYVF